MDKLEQAFIGAKAPQRNPPIETGQDTTGNDSGARLTDDSPRTSSLAESRTNTEIVPDFSPVTDALEKKG